MLCPIAGWLRGLLADYGVPLLVLAWSALSFALTSPPSTVLATRPANVPRRVLTPHVWEVTDGWGMAGRMAQVPGEYVGAALLPALAITVLFWFDHGVSAQMAQPKVSVTEAALASQL